MKVSPHSVRRATTADAAELAALAERTFRETFAAANTAANMDEHCRRNYGETIQAAEIVSQSGVTLVAERDGLLVGYAHVRFDASTPSCVTGRLPGELQRLYVAGEYHGSGVAQALMAASLSALARHGCDVAWLGVWERNPRAIAFYLKLGFREVGEHVFQLGADPQRDVVMVLPLQKPGSII
ncbi:GNAT family N-acetyltransferase [Desulfofustis limnaeus]|jgi:ribosomal protein S18 acetylase RimI-like enzyme|uniref:GNAT family N-acetyltransferase n=1 Tax=Desulfofustis limnaeus TaxID=2740163 RepID=A0ABM7W6Q9_9BACT|nr:GNAT family N-acetyltransferase [Desulfofustis limnaeus]MDX9895284.1 GNAT family N-acetyltransferase [Desulfofustis sp.]BDD86540.1 GNAT family N-acetyltransferase [Desulfofustis limnaeus]